MRFSLRTLLLFVLLLGCVASIKVRWDPWVIERILRVKGGATHAFFSPDGSSICSLNNREQRSDSFFSGSIKEFVGNSMAF